MRARLRSKLTFLQDPRALKPQVAAAETANVVEAPEVPREVSERLMQELAIRQSWPSYQEMLVRSCRFCYSAPADRYSPSAPPSNASHRCLSFLHHEHD